jgi:hypothetical protein
LTGGKLVQMPKRAWTKMAGRPSEQFSLKSTYEARLKNLTKANAKTAVDLTTPAVLPVTA